MRREKVGDLWRLREALPSDRLQTCGSHARGRKGVYINKPQL
jgi:hypothetical protein